MKSQIQRAFQQAKPKVQGRLRGVTPQQLDLLWQSREFQQFTDMLAQDDAAFIAKHMRPGVIQGPAPQPVPPGQWDNLLQRQLQSARLKGVSEATLRSNQTEVNNQMRPLWDTLLESAIQQFPSSEYGITEEEQTNQSFNLQYLLLQQNIQNENRAYTTLSAIMKTKKDTARNAISNLR